MSGGKQRWASLSHIAQGLNVSASTARRWANAFDDLLICRGTGASRRYLEPSTTKVLAHARELFSQGKNTVEVAELLRSRFPATIDGTTTTNDGDKPGEEADESGDTTNKAEGSPSPSHLPTTEAAGRAHLAAMRSLLEHVVELQQTIAELSATIEAADRRHEAQIADINETHRAALAELRAMIEARLPHHQGGEDTQTAAGRGIVARLRALFPLGRGPGKRNK